MYLPKTLCAWASHINCAKTPTIHTTWINSILLVSEEMPSSPFYSKLTGEASVSILRQQLLFRTHEVILYRTVPSWDPFVYVSLVFNSTWVSFYPNPNKKITKNWICWIMTGLIYCKMNILISIVTMYNVLIFSSNLNHKWNMVREMGTMPYSILLGGTEIIVNLTKALTPIIRHWVRGDIHLLVKISPSPSHPTNSPSL